MLKNLQIGNFKAFGDTQSFPIRPLTLIYGANSAGKSSILQSLLLFHEAENHSVFEEWIDDFPEWSTSKPDLDIVYPRLGGQLVDLGGWRSYVHKHQNSALVTLGWDFDLASVFLKEDLLTLADPTRYYQPQNQYPHVETLVEKFKKITLRLKFGLHPIRDPKSSGAHKPEVQMVEVSIDDSLVFRLQTPSSQSSEWGQRFTEVDYNHPFLKACKMTLEQKRIVKNLKERYQCFYSFFPERILDTFDGPDTPPPSDPFGQINPIDPIGQLILAVRTCAKSLAKSMCYLGGIRRLPPRFLATLDRSDPDYHSAGMDAWMRLKNGETANTNHWLKRLGLDYSIDPRTFGDIEPFKTISFGKGKQTKSMANKLSQALDESERMSFRELFLFHERSGTYVSHRDVGLGISQILPVIVQAAGSNRKTILIEQPEVHLHPKLQAELGDLFIESASGLQPNKFLIETHSEHLLLRVMRRMRETHSGKLPDGCRPVRPEHVAVLYVQPDGDRSIVREMPLNERGELIKAWPGGFFEEGLKEVF